MSRGILRAARALVRAGGASSPAVLTVLAAALCASALSLYLAPSTRMLAPAVAAESPSSEAERADATSATGAVGPPETAVYSTPGDRNLKLDVWRPAGDTAAGTAARRPAVIVVHGGGWSAGQRGRMPLWYRWFAAKGYVVFDVDYRLAPQPRWRAAPADVKCAVGWVKGNAARYGVDPERVALVGYSAGGHLALLSAYADDGSDLPAGCGAEDAGVAAVAAFYPPTDLTRLNRMRWPWAEANVVGLRSAERFLGGPSERLARRYRIASPTSHVDAGDPPTFLAHGRADRVVPPEQSELLQKRLLSSNVPHRLLKLPRAQHSFDHASVAAWRTTSAETARAALARFLESHLAAPGAGPAKEEARRR